jgi:hypothetical protein
MNDTQIKGVRRQTNAVGLVRPYAETLAMVAASTLAGMLIAPRWGNSAVDLLYLPAVLAAAGFYGLAPGVLAATASPSSSEAFVARHVSQRGVSRSTGGISDSLKLFSLSNRLAAARTSNMAGPRTSMPRSSQVGVA